MPKISILIIVSFFSLLGFSQQITPVVEQRAEAILKQMTLREKIDYIGGYNTFYIRAIPRLNVPEIRMADGPQGVRNNTKSTLYPCGVATTSTWNRQLMNSVGEGLGLDCRARGVHILLGPGVNIYRSPLCGRNFEYFGEDPYLASEVAVQYIKGVQSKGVMATVKHFAANNQEYNRHHVSSDVDKRTLHEIYFPPFRKAVQQANVGAVMNSYNLINSVHASENEYLNIDVLRTMWGFKGILMSDWTSVYSSVGAANGGLDLEMPKAKYMNYENLLPAIQNGLVTEKTIDDKVRYILQTIISFGFLDRPQLDKSIPEKNPYTENIALQIAREGIVLLKNENKVLPLNGKTLVLGPNANEIPTGGGSGFVDPHTVVSLCSGLKSVTKSASAFDYLPEPELATDLMKEGEFFTSENSTEKGLKAEFFKNMTLSGQPDLIQGGQSVDYDWHEDAPFVGFPKDNFSIRWSGVFKPKVTGKYKLKVTADEGEKLYFDGKELISDWANHGFRGKDVIVDVEAGKSYKIAIEYFEGWQDAGVKFAYARLSDEGFLAKVQKAKNVVLNIGFNRDLEGESFDRPFELPKNQQDLIDKISKLNKNLIVVLNAGGAVEIESWKDKAQAIIMAWYPGQQGGQALAEILTGQISPSGKLPISFEKKQEDNPTFNSYFDKRENPVHKRVQYSEGVFLGYRGYDKSGVEPLYPFGFGLSYASFEYTNLKLEKLANHRIMASFTVKNTGKMDAAEVAEVFVGDVVASVPRPLKELKGFEKVFLKKGESKTLSVVLDEDAFSFFDVNTNQFIVEPGDFSISVGSSSKDIRLKKLISL